MKTNNQRIVWNVPQIRWLFLLLGVFESGLERLLIFPSALLFVLLHFLFCAEDAVYIGTHGLEFFVIILEIMVSIVLGVLLNRKLLFFCSKVFHSRKLSIRRVLLQNSGRCCWWRRGWRATATPFCSTAFLINMA